MASAVYSAFVSPPAPPAHNNNWRTVTSNTPIYGSSPAPLLLTRSLGQYVDNFSLTNSDSQSQFYHSYRVNQRSAQQQPLQSLFTPTTNSQTEQQYYQPTAQTHTNQLNHINSQQSYPFNTMPNLLTSVGQKQCQFQIDNSVYHSLFLAHPFQDYSPEEIRCNDYQQFPQITQNLPTHNWTSQPPAQQINQQTSFQPYTSHPLAGVPNNYFNQTPFQTQPHTQPFSFSLFNTPQQVNQSQPSSNFYSNGIFASTNYSAPPLQFDSSNFSFAAYAQKVSQQSYMPTLSVDESTRVMMHVLSTLHWDSVLYFGGHAVSMKTARNVLTDNGRVIRSFSNEIIQHSNSNNARKVADIAHDPYGTQSMLEKQKNIDAALTDIINNANSLLNSSPPQIKSAPSTPFKSPNTPYKSPQVQFLSPTLAGKSAQAPAPLSLTSSPSLSPSRPRLKAISACPSPYRL